LYYDGSVVTKEGNRSSALRMHLSENNATIRFFSQHGMKVSFRDLLDFWRPPNLAKLQAMVDAKLKSSRETCGETKSDDHFVEPLDSAGIEKLEREAEQVSQMEQYSSQEPLTSEPHANRVWADNWVWLMVMIVLGECVPLSSDFLLTS